MGSRLESFGQEWDDFVKRISYADCILNAALQLTSSVGNVSVMELQARAAHAEAWLHLGEAIKLNGWIDLNELNVFLGKDS